MLRSSGIELNVEWHIATEVAEGPNGSESFNPYPTNVENRVSS